MIYIKTPEKFVLTQTVSMVEKFRLTTHSIRRVRCSYTHTAAHRMLVAHKLHVSSSQLAWQQLTNRRLVAHNCHVRSSKVAGWQLKICLLVAHNTHVIFIFSQGKLLISTVELKTVSRQQLISCIVSALLRLFQLTLYMSPKCEMVARGREGGSSSRAMERSGRVTPSTQPRYWPRLAGPRLELTYIKGTVSRDFRQFFC